MNAHDDLAEPFEVHIEGRPHSVGTTKVVRVLPVAQRRMVGPFVFLDHFGPAVVPPGVGFDVAPHPHIGLSTVTYLYAGENVHRDSLGTLQINRSGDVNVMTAGRGIVHSERATPEFRARGGTMHGVQLWIALPEANENDEPTFQHYPQRDLPAAEIGEGVRVAVLFGNVFGLQSPIVHPSQPALAAIEMPAGATLLLPAHLPDYGVFVVDGEVFGGDVAVRANALVVPAAKARRGLTLRASAPTLLLLLGGPPLSHRFMDWNFVGSNRTVIEQAKQAWMRQEFPKIPGDEHEYVPYPTLPSPAGARRRKS